MTTSARETLPDDELARILKMSEGDRDRLRDELLARIDLAELVRAEDIALRRDGRDLRALCPFHDDHSPSLTVYAKGGRQRFKCFGCGARGDAIEWSRLRSGKTYHEALAELARRFGTVAAMPAPRRAPPARSAPREFATEREAADALRARYRTKDATEGVFAYRGPAGELLGGCLRFDHPGRGKTMRYLWRAPSGRWRIEGFRDLPPIPPRPLYRLPKLLAADASEPVFVFEGERKTDRAVACGLLATSSSHGAHAAEGTDWAPLRGRVVVVVPDRDKSGARFARDVARLAAAAGATSVRVVELWRRWPDLPEGGDIADLAEGLGPAQLAQLGAAVRELSASAERYARAAPGGEP